MVNQKEKNITLICHHTTLELGQNYQYPIFRNLLHESKWQIGLISTGYMWVNKTMLSWLSSYLYPITCVIQMNRSVIDCFLYYDYFWLCSALPTVFIHIDDAVTCTILYMYFRSESILLTVTCVHSNILKFFLYPHHIVYCIPIIVYSFRWILSYNVYQHISTVSTKMGIMSSTQSGYLQYIAQKIKGASTDHINKSISISANVVLIFYDTRSIVVLLKSSLQAMPSISTGKSYPSYCIDRIQTQKYNLSSIFIMSIKRGHIYSTFIIIIWLHLFFTYKYLWVIANNEQ